MNTNKQFITPNAPQDWANPALLEETFQQVERAFGIALSLSDRTALFLADNARSVFPLPRLRHQRDYCEWGRTKSVYDQACLQHCALDVQQEAGRRGEPFIHCCWKGAAELVVPIMHEGTHICTISAGTWASPEPFSAPLPRDLPKELARLHEQLPPYDEERMLSLVSTLLLLGQGLIALWQQRLNRDGTLDRANAIRRFLHLRIGADIRLRDLADYLHLSSSRTGALVRETLGCSFQEAVLQERLRRAKYLLLHSRQLVKTVAGEVGFQSDYYFSRIFQKRFGVPPGRWRAAQCKGADGMYGGE